MKTILTIFLMMLCEMVRAESGCVVNGMDANGAASPSMENYCLRAFNMGDPFGICYLSMNTELSAIFSAANAFDQTLENPVNGP